MGKLRNFIDAVYSVPVYCYDSLHFDISSIYTIFPLFYIAAIN